VNRVVRTVGVSGAEADSWCWGMTTVTASLQLSEIPTISDGGVSRVDLKGNAIHDGSGQLTAAQLSNVRTVDATDRPRPLAPTHPPTHPSTRSPCTPSPSYPGPGSAGTACFDRCPDRDHRLQESFRLFIFTSILVLVHSVSRFYSEPHAPRSARVASATL
jgi:hypothetical protein